MNNKLLLVKAIILLYREMQVGEGFERSTGLIRNVIQTIKLPESPVDMDAELEVIASLRQLALTMCDAPSDVEYDANEFLPNLKVICGTDLSLYESFEASLLTEYKPDKLKKICIRARREIHAYFKEESFKKLITTAASEIKFKRETIEDFPRWVANFIANAEPYQVAGDIKDPAVISEVDFSRPDEVRQEFAAIKDEAAGVTILKTGWQGFNRMCRGGIRRGHQTTIAALQHNWKTGFSLSLFRQLAMYNVPVMDDPTKKPLMVRITLEDALTENLRFLYTSIKENQTRAYVPESTFITMSDEECSEYVISEMSKTGYYIKMTHANPTEWSYQGLLNKLIEYEAEGYEIHVLMIDYLNLLPKVGCSSDGTNGSEIRDLFRRVRNWCKQRNIAFITPHQLSSDVKEKIRNEGDESKLVTFVAGKGFYDGCRRLDQEIDLEIFIHLVKVNGRWYLTIQRGKHRLTGKTPDDLLYMVLAFESLDKSRTGIYDDLLGEDTTLKRCGGGAIGTTEEIPWWETPDQAVPA